MRKRFNIIMLTLLCLFCIMPDAMADTNYTANTTINIRAKADKSGKVLGKVQAGDIISVSSIEGDWAAIDFNGKTAYVSKEYITKVEEEEPAVEEEKKEGWSWGTILLIVLAVYVVFKLIKKLLFSVVTRTVLAKNEAELEADRIRMALSSAMAERPVASSSVYTEPKAKMSYTKLEVRYITDGINSVNRSVKTRQNVVKKKTLILPKKVQEYGNRYGYNSLSLDYHQDHIIIKYGYETLMDTDINGAGNNEYIRGIESYDWQ